MTNKAPESPAPPGMDASPSPAGPGRGFRTILFILTVIAGFAAFAVPNLFFGITGWNGGLSGINLGIIGLAQLMFVSVILWASLRRVNRGFADIGLRFDHLPRDAAIGAAAGLIWTGLQHVWLIPVTGGAARADVAGMLEMMDGSWMGLAGYLILGIVGGGIAEEMFNRGYFINGMRDLFSNNRLGLWIAVIASILFFALGHLPQDAVEWFDILVPTAIYTALFLITGRLTAGMVAHGLYNGTIILLVQHSYA